MGEVRVSVQGAGAAADRFGRMRVRLPEVVERAPHDVADATVKTFRAVAPVRTGALARNIHAEGGDVVSTVRSPEGFPYTGATRFGRGPIVAKNAHALRFNIGGQTIFRKSVGPYKPAGDWAARAFEPARVVARDRFRRLIADAIGS